MKGVLYYELLEPGQTDTEDRYSDQLNRLSDIIEQKRPFTGQGRRKVILLHDISQLHVNRATRKTILNLGWQVLPHAEFSPDLVPSYYHLFHSMAHGIAEIHFRNVEDIKKFVDDFIASKPTSFYHDDIRMLPDRWLKVAETNGDYYPD